MPHKQSPSRATFTRLVLVALAGWALYALRRRSAEDAREPDGGAVHGPTAQRAEAPSGTARAAHSPRARRRRFATSLAFATLFFAGAALSAGAGDAIVQAIEPDETTAAATACESDEATADEASGETACSASDDDVAADAGDGSTTEPASDDSTAEDHAGADDGAGDDNESTSEGASEESGDTADQSTAPAKGAEGDEGSESAAGDSGKGPDASAAQDGGKDKDADDQSAPPVLASQTPEDDGTAALDPEADAAGTLATVWLHRALGDPTPPARRLAPAFASRLRAESRRAGVGWALVLGALRADGHTGRVPADRATLRSLATRLSGLREAGEWQAFLALRGRTAYADRAMALTRYNRAVGLRALVTGLEAAKAPIADRVLADGRLEIYPGGRADVQAGRIDVRVLVLMRYLAEAYGEVTVSSLQTGHRLYARPGVVSAHVYGLAVDVAALGGSPIMGNSQPGGLTEHAVRDILLLPAELRPRQVISLLGLGGPSFPLADHADHIHVGY